MPRASDCTRYAECLTAAARHDADAFTCPCPNYQHDPQAVTWRDVAACRHLALAVLRPEAFELFQALLHTHDRDEKWRLLRSAWPALGLRKRDMIAGPG